MNLKINQLKDSEAAKRKTRQTLEARVSFVCEGAAALLRLVARQEELISGKGEEAKGVLPETVNQG